MLQSLPWGAGVLLAGGFGHSVYLIARFDLSSKGGFWKTPTSSLYENALALSWYR